MCPSGGSLWGPRHRRAHAQRSTAHGQSVNEEQIARAHALAAAAFPHGPHTSTAIINAFREAFIKGCTAWEGEK